MHETIAQVILKRENGNPKNEKHSVHFCEDKFVHNSHVLKLPFLFPFSPLQNQANDTTWSTHPHLRIDEILSNHKTWTGICWVP